jgi:hypothetical protein
LKDIELSPFGTGGQRSKVMLRILIVILRGDRIAVLVLRARERHIPLIISLRAVSVILRAVSAIRIRTVGAVGPPPRACG